MTEAVDQIKQADRLEEEIEKILDSSFKAGVELAENGNKKHALPVNPDKTIPAENGKVNK